VTTATGSHVRTAPRSWPGAAERGLAARPAFLPGNRRLPVRGGAWRRCFRAGGIWRVGVQRPACASCWNPWSRGCRAPRRRCGRCWRSACAPPTACRGRRWAAAWRCRTCARRSPSTRRRRAGHAIPQGSAAFGRSGAGRRAGHAPAFLCRPIAARPFSSCWPGSVSALIRGNLRGLMLDGAPDEPILAALAAADAAGAPTGEAKA